MKLDNLFHTPTNGVSPIFVCYLKIILQLLLRLLHLHLFLFINTSK